MSKPFFPQHYIESQSQIKELTKYIAQTVFYRRWNEKCVIYDGIYQRTNKQNNLLLIECSENTLIKIWFISEIPELNISAVEIGGPSERDGILYHAWYEDLIHDNSTKNGYPARCAKENQMKFAIQHLELLMKTISEFSIGIETAGGL